MKEDEIKIKFKEYYEKRENERGSLFNELPIGKRFVDDKNKDYKWIDLLFVKEEDMPSEKILPKPVWRDERDLLITNEKIRLEGVRFKPDTLGFTNFMENLKGKSVKIFEVKQKLDFKSIGQILGYEAIFREEYPEIIIEEKGIVYERGDEILEKVCKEHKIGLYKIPIEKIE